MTDDSKTEAPDPPSTETSEGPDQLQRERGEYYELLLRKTAEFDNFRKRIDRERAAIESAAASDLIADLLPLVDDLERALDVDTDAVTVSSYREGVDLIRRQLLDVLEKRGVSTIDTVGEEFDPHVHQAVATEAATDHRDGEVIEELRRGYMIRGRLLRAAMVRVAKA
jgi:molecular chaperone GrpE